MPVLKTLVEPQTKTRFHAMAQARALSESELLRQLILVVMENNKATPQPASADATRTDRVQITVRLPRFLAEEISGRARDKGMLASRWVASLLQSHLMQQPVMTSAELNALHASTRELAALGRNINQIARALNAAFYEKDRVKLAQLDALRQLIDRNRAAIRNLVRASQQAWSVNNYAPD
jgi:hypothetical protein